MSKRDYLFKPSILWPTNWGDFFDLGSKFWHFTEDKFGRANIYSDDTTYTVEIYAGEAKEEDFTISYDDTTSTLKVAGKLPAKTNEDRPNQKKVVMEEWSFTVTESNFSREFHLPDVDSANISAKLDNKTLVIVLPKVQYKSASVHTVSIGAPALAAC